MPYLFSFLILCVCLLVGKAIQAYFELAVPGSILGMLILFTLLATNLISVTRIEKSSKFLIKHMAVLFLPAGVGLMNHFELITDNALPILLGTLGSSLIVLITIAFLVQRLHKGGQ